MTVQAHDGPIITIGAEQPLGTANQPVGVAGIGPYITGSAENPDAGPNCFFAGNMFKDPLYRYQRGRGSSGFGAPNQALGFLDHEINTVDFIPSTIAAANIAALQSPVASTALTLVAASGAGITVTTAAVTVLNSGLIVPTAQRLIDAVPSWVSVSLATGAMQAWNRAAMGRAISLTSGADLHLINFTIKGYDLYGRPQTETLAGPNVNTVNGKKGWKWISSVTPSASSGSTVSVGTADIFEFPIRADKFSQVYICVNNTWITASTGFVAADATSPATATTGATRGTYALQTPSNNAIATQVFQTVPPANLVSLAGVFGITPF